MSQDRQSTLQSFFSPWYSQGGSKSKGKTEKSEAFSGPSKSNYPSAGQSKSEDPTYLRSRSFADSQQRHGEDLRPCHEAMPPLRAIPGSYNPSSGLEYGYSSVHTYEKTHPNDDSRRQSEHGGRSEGYHDHGSDQDMLGSRGKSNDDHHSQRNSRKNKLIPRVLKLSKEEYSGDGSHLEQYDPRSETMLQNMRQDMHQLKAENKRLSNRISELSSKLQVEEENNIKLKESTNKMLIAMENKDLFVGRQDTDDVVSSRFGLLMRQIFTWSVPFAQHEAPPSLDDFPQLPSQDVQRILPSVTDFGLLLQFLRNSKNIRLFVRGWVTLAISEMLFRNLPSDPSIVSETQDVWMDAELAQAVHLIEIRFFHADRRSISARDLHDWRALTTSLISRQASSSKTGKGMEGRITECSQRILTVVRPLAPQDKMARLEEDLEGILLQAVKLSQTLRCQRASWSIRHPMSPQAASHGSPVLLDPSVMEDKHGDDDSDGDEARPQYRRIVEIIMTPALFKRGNTDGEQFDVEACVQRAQVVSLPTVVPNEARASKYGAHH